MYDADVVSEEAYLAWADEKEHADEDDKVYLAKVCVAVLPDLCMLNELSWGKGYVCVALWPAMMRGESTQTRTVIGVKVHGGIMHMTYNNTCMHRASKL